MQREQQEEARVQEKQKRISEENKDEQRLIRQIEEINSFSDRSSPKKQSIDRSPRQVVTSL